MYPRAEEFLIVQDVVDGWVRSGPVRADPDHALTNLVQAFWLDELPLFNLTAPETADRLTFLKGLHDLAEPSEILFVETEADIPPAMPAGPDGSVLVDMSSYVLLPSDPTEWQHERLEPAYETLATLPASAYPPSFRIAFNCHRISRQDFGRLCDLRGWPRPAFWFKSQANASSIMTSRDLVGCRKWLRQLATSPKKHVKDEYFDQAKKRFPTLSRKSFDKLWGEIMRKAWRKAGRPRGRRR